MRSRAAAHVGLAIVRAVVEEGPQPVIRVIQMDDVFADERMLGVTSSPDDAARMIRDWLVGVIGRRHAAVANGDDTVTPA